MNKTSSSSPLDIALEQVDPERRRFLGMLLAGVAAAPLLTSSDLDAQNQAHFPKGQLKTQTWTKGGITGRNDRSIKAQNNMNSKYGKGNSQTIKHDSSNVKSGSPAVKSDVIELKTQSPTSSTK